MKVSEILNDDVIVVTEELVLDRIKRMDWKYEFSDDVRRMTKGARDLDVLENMVYQLWKKNPQRAVQIWNESVPGIQDKTATPSFIFRLATHDE